MSEDRELLARISQVAGHINRYKNQQDGVNSLAYMGAGNMNYNTHDWNYSGDRSSRSRPYGRGRARGGRIAPSGHRNRTLILNNAINQAPTTNDPSNALITTEGAHSDTSGSGSGWVAKRDRHMQLINSSIYDKESQARARSMEESRKQKAKHKEERQRLKFKRYLQNASSSSNHPTSCSPGTNGAYHEVVIGGVRYQVTLGGSKLRKARGELRFGLITTDGREPTVRLIDLDDPNSAKATPKRAIVGGVTFLRSKNGNLWRSGVVRAQRSGGPVPKKTQPCKYFTTTGTCSKGPLCPYIHDPSKVAICKDFLQKGSCTAGDACDLSHDPTPHRVPACVHFLRGNCSNADCRYAHVRVNPGAPICRPFATLGFCEKGGNCAERHVHECPDYGNTGTCNGKHCKLPHVDRAGKLRKTATAAGGGLAAENTLNGKATETAEGDQSDISSEGEDYDEIDSDDVDSDGLTEDLSASGVDDEDSREISKQQDFIHF